jgi:glycosyltransferase involved in cell wall biosynthesis
VIHLLHLVASSRGGGAAHVRDLALRLDRSQFAVQAAMPEDGGNVRRQDFESAGIPFHRVDIAAGFSPQAFGRIRRLLAEADILHVHGARAALLGRLAAFSLGRRRPCVVYTIHGFAAPHYPQPRRGVLLAIERALSPVTDLFIAVCHAEREALLKAGITLPDYVQVVWNGIDVTRFQDVGLDQAAQRISLGVPSDAILMTTVCRLYKPRDLDTLLRAFRQASDVCPAAHLLVVGDGPLRPKVERQISALSLVNRVTLAGWRDDLPAIYASSDVYVLTTWGWEGLPLTVLEAMSAGLPVVATDAGGTGEAVEHGITGLLVPRRDVEQLAGAFMRLVNDADLRRFMGQAGRQRAGVLFGVEKMVERVQALYVRMLA